MLEGAKSIGAGAATSASARVAISIPRIRVFPIMSLLRSKQN